MPTFQEFSRGNTRVNEEVDPRGARQLGAILRIADAVEKVAASYDALRTDRDNYRRWYEERGQRLLRLEHRCAGLRGAITKMRKKLKGRRARAAGSAR